MKTQREWLNELPSPYKEQAINNFEKSLVKVGVPITHNGTNECSAKKALKSAFVWADSPEGRDYWFNYHTSLTI